MENKYFVYMHINEHNNKKYIGITKNYKKRWRKGEGYKGQERFYRAIKKYGWDNFRHVILEKNLTLEEAYQKEIYYIKKHDSMFHGYNCDEGGGVDISKINFRKKEVEAQVKKNIDSMPHNRIAKVIFLARDIDYQLTDKEEQTIENYYYKGDDYKEEFLQLKKNMEAKMLHNAKQKKLKEDYYNELKEVYSKRKKYQRYSSIKHLAEAVHEKYSRLLDDETINLFIK